MAETRNRKPGERAASAAEVDRRRTPLLWQEWMALPSWEEREAAAAGERFRSPAFVREMIRHGHDLVVDEPARARALGRLAGELAGTRSRTRSGPRASWRAGCRWRSPCASAWRPAPMSC